MQKIFYIFLFIAGIMSFNIATSYAMCGTCTIPRLGKDEAANTQGKKQRLYFEYLFEQKNWDKMDAGDAHQLHHQGHDFHDKTTEDLHHFKIGGYPLDDLHVFVDIPYVIRRSLEVDDHSILGSKQRSEGWGDLNLIGDYRFWKTEKQSLGIVGGAKFPTGATKEQNSEGTRFESELQPGSGSYDYLAGSIYRWEGQRASLTGNLVYVFTTEGAQNFQYGDQFTASLYFDYWVNREAKYFKTRVGIDTIYQNEQRQKEDGVKVTDSGGESILAGPAIKVDTTENMSLLSSILYPVYQNPGGVHQKLDFEWTLGGQIKF